MTSAASPYSFLQRPAPLTRGNVTAEVTAVIAVRPHEPTDARTGQRYGHSPRLLSTTARALELRHDRFHRMRLGVCAGVLVVAGARITLPWK